MRPIRPDEVPERDAAKAENERLRAEFAQMASAYDRAVDEKHALAAQRDAARAEVERLKVWSSDSHVTELDDQVNALRAALKRYGRHVPTTDADGIEYTCPASSTGLPNYGACTCGLEEALR